MTDTSTHTIPFHIVAMIGTAAGGPAVDVKDKRVRAVFAMAPGLIQVFGMDEAARSRGLAPSAPRSSCQASGLVSTSSHAQTRRSQKQERSCISE